MKQVNILIEKNNNTTKEFYKELQNAAHSLEKYFVLKHAETYNKINKQLSELKQTKEHESKKLKNLENEKNIIIQKINNYKIAAEEFNKKLKLLLGYNELSLEPFEEGYKILRNGEIAQNLSEGERNIISLIYFLIKLKENTFDAKNGIVVIDDPVSSLDSQNSYGVYALIKEASQELKPKQLFIFTHNYQFFKLIRDWFKHSRRDASIYFLRSKFRNQNRVSDIEMADKLLLEHNSEYTFLFKLIYSKAKTPSSSLEEDYILPNVLRKFLESYISFKVPLSGVNIHEKLRKLSEDYPNLDKTLIHRLESFTQDQSHPLYHDSIYDFDERLLGEIQLACRNILQLLKATDPNHLKHLLSEIGESTERLEI